MKLKYKLEVLDMAGSPIAVPVDCSENEFRGIVQINGTTESILRELENDVTEDEIVAALKNEYDATEEQIRHSVRKVVHVLQKNGLLIE